MLARGAGKIINQASAAAFLPGSLYRISKHNLVGLTAGLAVELGPKNINVNAIAPGLIMSEAGFKSAGAAGTEKRESRYASIPHARPDRPRSTWWAPCCCWPRPTVTSSMDRPSMSTEAGSSGSEAFYGYQRGRP